MTQDNNQSNKVAPGGPATINGVLYQMLWSLLRASRATFISTPTVNAGSIQDAVMLLEPAGGGGDLVLEDAKRRFVEQVKARPDGGTWSLREIVEDVIPDLYIAADDASNETDFRFVTEGRMGRWNDVYKFFSSLKHRPWPEGDPLSDLSADDRTPLTFATKRGRNVRCAGGPPFWDRGSYTERTLFQRIVTEVRKRTAVQDREDEATTQERLRFVLGRFEFVGGQHMNLVQQEIDSHLAAIINRIDDLPRVRDSLAMQLARRATSGDAEIRCHEFFQSEGLNAVPLTEWGLLRAASRRLADATLQNLGYDSSLDVRLASVEETLANWLPTTPVLAITGGSGCGKSWRSYAMCALGQPGKSLSVAVKAGASVDVTLDRAAAAVWQGIGGHDEQIPLQQIAKRVARVLGKTIGPWLTLIVDGILSQEQAAEMVQQPWENLGIRVGITVDPHTAESIESQSRGRCIVARVGDFSDGELQAYLESFLGEQWSAIPSFVRNPLRNPFLASIYRRIVESLPQPKWTPSSEYEIFARFWARLQEQEAMDCVVLRRLAETFLADAVYPWTDRHLADAGAGHNGFIRRLERLGWLRVTYSATGSSFELPHARLLNCVCARALFEQIKQGSIETEAIRSTLQSFLNGTSEKHHNRLGFVPMDFLWLMCRDNHVRTRVKDVIAGLEGHYRQQEVLYEKLLPTLGPPIIDALVARLRETIADAYLSKMIAHAIGSIGGNEATEMGSLLLNDGNPLIQRAAATLLAACPSGDALDALWALHNAAQAEPTRFLREHERAHPHALYEETFGALRESCRRWPDWLANAIDRAASKCEAVSDLAYLLANVGGDEGARLWQAKKAALFAKVPHEKRRSLARCIDIYADRDALRWLIDHIGETEDLLGAAAFRSLARLSPTDAVQQLHKLPRRDVYLTRSWFADHLFAVAPEATREKLREMMRNDDDLWTLAAVYSGRLHRMDAQTLSLLLDDLEGHLASVLEIRDWNGSEPLIGPLTLLAEVNTKELLDHFAEQRGSSLEANLCDFVLRIGPRRGLDADSYVREKALDVLYRINGDGFIIAVDSLLRAESRYGRYDGLVVAGKKPSGDTIALLEGITEQDETWDGHYVEQCHAAEILAEHGVWEPVVALVRRIGLKTLNDVTDVARRGQRPPAEAISHIAAVVSMDPQSASAGDILALGFGGPDCSQIITTVSETCDPAGQVAHACVIALEMLRDHSDLSVRFLAGQLGVPEHAFSATNALIINGTQSALEALGHVAKRDPFGAVAINLVTRHSDRAAAVEQAREAINRSVQEPGRWAQAVEMQSMIARTKDDTVASELLSSPEVEEFLRAEAFADESDVWRTGAKAAAIVCLGYLDSRSAFVAAKTALLNRDSHDRDLYPAILAKLDPAKALTVLLGLLLTESVEPVKKSIGRMLAILDVESAIISGLEAADTDARRVACYTAGWAKKTDEITMRLAHCLNDANDSVASAAVEAVSRIAVRDETQSLCEALLAATDSAQRWLYLDCLISLADPGDSDHPWPLTGPNIASVLSPLQIAHASKRLKKRRDEDGRRR